MRFYLGTTDPSWLDRPDFEGIDLFVSRTRLVGPVTEVRARTRWALDSGAFTELSRHGRWTVTPARYAAEAGRWQADIGRMDFAATQDWMCEPDVLARTGKSVAEHQHLTTRSFLELRELQPGVPWLPVLQGWRPDDYLAHLDQYARAGVDLTREPAVGVGSVCRRQDTAEAETVMRALYRLGVKTHGFGVKQGGLLNVGRCMASADSMAWSYAARFRPVRLPACTHAFPTCEYCPRWALAWRQRLFRLLGPRL